MANGYSSEEIVVLIASALVRIGKNDLEGAIKRLEKAITLIRGRARQRG